MLKRIYTLFMMRNFEFFRDREGLAWDFLFPFLIVIGFSVIFNQDDHTQYKIGVLNSKTVISDVHFKRFSETKFIEKIDFDNEEKALSVLRHHRIDMLIDPSGKKYWVSTSSPKGYMAERLLLSAGIDKKNRVFAKETITGREIPYVEWVFPGILGMNIMFSSLFGVGFIVVRYRKNGVLKRLSVTPTRPYEFLVSQVLSRMFLLMFTTFIVFTGCSLIYGFECRGSYFDLFILFALGGFTMISLGLVVASRSSSEEFASGILNLITWPMMFLSEVWFSLEGTREGVRTAANFFPLYQMVQGVRRIMNDGAGLMDLKINILVLAGMAVVFITAGSLLFKWQED